MKPIQLHSVDDHDWTRILSESREEGYGMVKRLRTDFREGTNRFDAPGEFLLAVLSGDCVVAVGGLNRESDPAFRRAGRIRRLYVMPEFRSRGVGRNLVEEIIAHARADFDQLTLNVGKLPARGFYEHLGFIPTDHPNVTHTKTLRGG